MILSRPPALFPALPYPNTANHSAHNHSAGHDDHDHGEADEGGYELVGILSALAVPTLSAWIVIITR